MNRERDRTFLRVQLASIGIVLEPAVAPSSEPGAATVPGPAATPEVDRDQVREILVAAGASETDLDWLVRSCTSIEDAKGYRPPARQAWCVSCGGVTDCDGKGCIACRRPR